MSTIDVYVKRPVNLNVCLLSSRVLLRQLPNLWGLPQAQDDSHLSLHPEEVWHSIWQGMGGASFVSQRDACSSNSLSALMSLSLCYLVNRLLRRLVSSWWLSPTPITPGSTTALTVLNPPTLPQRGGSSTANMLSWWEPPNAEEYLTLIQLVLQVNLIAVMPLTDWTLVWSEALLFFSVIVFVPQRHGEDFHGCVCKEIPARALWVMAGRKRCGAYWPFKTHSRGQGVLGGLLWHWQQPEQELSGRLRRRRTPEEVGLFFTVRLGCCCEMSTVLSHMTGLLHLLQYNHTLM